MKRILFCICFVSVLIGQQHVYAKPQLDLAENAIQTIEFSSSYIKEMPLRHDEQERHIAELMAPDTKFSRNLILKIDGKIVKRDIFWNSRLMIGDVDNDHLPEVFVYEYSIGSSGAMGLSVFRMMGKRWTSIFSDPEDISQPNEEQRFTGKLAGHNRITFYDNVTQLSGELDLAGSRFSEKQLENMSFQTDPISEYIIHFENIGCQMETVRWIFAFSHPNAVLSVHDSYLYDFKEKVFRLYETKIRSNEQTLAHRSYY
ncbi:hypothetical protein M3194_05370 [Paenibacillus glycanilyticus]|uniref:hypothetical protein n=1 Tax=Paenibacillus glycanilyticus TaxID=126569 RepID=UPI002040B021|nr:hypothetical protein [Paenibacillus glycanilyticus]MCM3626788.1 hypothetical protein [Paenibacillus glycanilyticus]